MSQTYSTKIGSLYVEANNQRIFIVGDYNSNHGIFYTHNIERFNNHPNGKEHDWNRPQVIAMDWDYGLVPKVKEWLYKLVRDGKITETNKGD